MRKISSLKRLACIGSIVLLFINPWLPMFSNATQIKQTRPKPSAQVDFTEVAARFPRLRTMARIQFERSISLQILDRLSQLGVRSHHGGPVGVLGKKEGVFFVRARNLPKLMESKLPIKVEPLVCFRMAGLYQVHFRVVDKDFNGKIIFRVSAPRNGFGKKLVHREEQVSPSVEITHEKDPAGNHWMVVPLDVTEESHHLKLDFYFIYEVDVAELLKHSLAMVSEEKTDLPVDSIGVMQMLKSSPKIDADAPPVEQLAKNLFRDDSELLTPRLKYNRILGFIKKNLPYDYQKRAQFFGGKMVYTSMAQMYNHPEVTLSKGIAACPSASILETALLRAGGVPSRTVGRWGHFYTELYQPGWGWLSTSVTPTGIPLVRDVDHRHVPFVSWEPKISVQTTRWRGQVRVME